MTESRPRRRTQTERRAESERRLLEATASLVVERGLNNVSLVEIGKRAGYSHALVNHLFGSKAALIERLTAVAADYYQENTKHILDQSGVDAMSTMIEVYLRLVTGNDPIGKVSIVLWAEAVAGTQEIQPARAQWDHHFRAGVSTVVARAAAEVGTGIDVEGAAFVIVGLLRGVAMQLLVDPESMSLPAATDHVRRVAFDLIRSG